MGGWEISGIYTEQSGQFLTPFWSGDDPAGVYFTDNASPAQVTIRPDILDNPNYRNTVAAAVVRHDGASPRPRRDISGRPARE